MVDGYVILLIVIVLVIILTLIAVININSAKDLPKSYRHIIAAEKSTYADIDTGDILLVGYQATPGGWFIRSFTHSLWCHTGIAFRDADGDLWVLEAAGYSKERNGLFFIPFEIWATINRKQSLAYLKYNGPEINRQQVLQIFNDFKDVTLDAFNFGWARFLTLHQYREERASDRAFTCYELTVTILQRLNIIKKDLLCSSYFPRDIAYRKFNTESGISYCELMGINLVSVT